MHTLAWLHSFSLDFLSSVIPVSGYFLPSFLPPFYFCLPLACSSVFLPAFFLLPITFLLLFPLNLHLPLYHSCFPFFLPTAISAFMLPSFTFPYLTFFLLLLSLTFVSSTVYAFLPCFLISSIYAFLPPFFPSFHPPVISSCLHSIIQCFPFLPLSVALPQPLLLSSLLLYLVSLSSFTTPYPPAPFPFLSSLRCVRLCARASVCKAAAFTGAVVCGMLVSDVDE